MLSLAAECRKPSMRWRNCLKITGIFLALLIGFSILMTGCGGGGGGDTASTLDPEQLEVAAIVDRFAAAVRAEDSAAAADCIDSNLKYRRVGGVTEGLNELKSALNTFFAGAVVKDFQITNVGIQVADDQAVGRADLSLSWADNNAVDKPILNENIELVFARTGGLWGILEFGVYSQKGSAFPPEP